MAAEISTRNRATMEKSSLFVEVESLCGATGYLLLTPRLEDTVLDAHTLEPIITVITERCLGVLRFCRSSQPGHNQKLAHLISEIRVERLQLIFCTNCHEIDITTGYCSWVEIHVCVCVFSSHSFWTSMDVPAGVTQEEGHTGFIIYLLSAVHALIFLARRIQPFLFLVDREVEFRVLTI